MPSPAAQPTPPEFINGYRLAPAAWADLEGVLALRIAQNQADFQQDGLTAGGLAESWQAAGFEAGRDHWLVRAPDERCLAYAELRGSDQPGQFDLILAASPAQAAAQPALHALVQRAAQRAAERAGGRPWQLTCRLGLPSVALAALLEAHGFTLRLTFHIMETGLRQPPPPSALPPGLSIRCFQAGPDDQAVYRADEEASEDKGYHAPLSYDEWCTRMGRHSDWFDPQLWFLAFIDGELAGAALNFYDAASSTAWVDHLGVRRAFRGRGIGMALLAHSLQAFRQRGYALARLSVDSHSLTHAPRLYEKAGFQTVLGYHIYHGADLNLHV